MTRRNEVVLLLPFDSSDESEPLVKYWSLTPPFDFTPPRKPHVDPYPPDGFIPQAELLRLCEGVVELVGRWAGNR